MKRFIGIFTILIAVSIIGTFKYSTLAHIYEGPISVHIDDVTYRDYDSDANYLRTTNELKNGTVEDAIYWSYYQVYRITDETGKIHELWFHCNYTAIDMETGHSIYLGGWRLTTQEIDAFFLAHTSLGD